MAKYALVMMSSDDYPEGRGRMAHVLVNAEKLRDAGHDVRVIFEGQGVQWLKTFEEREHPFAKHYGERFDRVKDLIFGACDFCTNGRFEVGEHVERLGVNILGEDGGHHDLAATVGDGYQVLVY